MRAEEYADQIGQVADPAPPHRRRAHRLHEDLAGSTESWRIVQERGDSLEFAGEVGKATTVRIMLPTTAAPSP